MSIANDFEKLPTEQRPVPTTANDLAARSSHRGGQGFKSPQLHQVSAGQRRYFRAIVRDREPCRDPRVTPRVWRTTGAGGMAKTRSTSTTSAGAMTAGITKAAPAHGAASSRSVFSADGKRCRKKVSGKTK